MTEITTVNLVLDDITNIGNENPMVCDMLDVVAKDTDDGPSTRKMQSKVQCVRLKRQQNKF